MLRVITGTAKGRKLIAPLSGTRPITDRIKTSIFDLIKDFIPNANVLDLYAGSGAFGIEALSRGAAFATFVDKGSEAIDCIETNLNKTGFEEVSRIDASDVNDFISTTDEKYDIIFSDPPFDSKREEDFSGLAKIVKHDGIIVYRVPINSKIEIKGLDIAHKQEYGKSLVYFLRKPND